MPITEEYIRKKTCSGYRQIMNFRKYTGKPISEVPVVVHNAKAAHVYDSRHVNAEQAEYFPLAIVCSHPQVNGLYWLGRQFKSF